MFLVEMKTFEKKRICRLFWRFLICPHLFLPSEVIRFRSVSDAVRYSLPEGEPVRVVGLSLRPHRMGLGLPPDKGHLLV
jgi:hypothetical protein